MFQWQVRRFLDASIESFLSPFVESFERDHVNTAPNNRGPHTSSSGGDSPNLDLRRAASDASGATVPSRVGDSWDRHLAAGQHSSASWHTEREEAYLSGGEEMLYTSVKLKQAVLSALGFPFTVAHGTVGRITVSIPPLFSQLPIVVSIDSVLILLVPQDQAEWRVVPARSSHVRNRRRRLERVTELLIREKQRSGTASVASMGANNFPDGVKGGKGATGTGGMQAYIRNNLQQMLLSKLKIQLSNVHIRYEHHPKAALIPVAAPFSCGVVLPYLLLDHASVTAAAAAAARAAIATTQQDGGLGGLPGLPTAGLLRLPAVTSEEQFAEEATGGIRDAVRSSELKKVGTHEHDLTWEALN